MKLSAVYKSPKKADTYLYVSKRDDFSSVPEALLKQFGTPIFKMLIPLSKRDNIAGIPTARFIKTLTDKGFYLQLPPKVESLLEAHLKGQHTSALTLHKEQADPRNESH